MLHGIFDSHAHYDANRFGADRDRLLLSLPEKGVAHVMNAASDLDSARAGIALCEKYGYFFCAAGIHPHDAKDAPPDYLAQIRALAAHPKVLAVGETGLDYHYDFSPRDRQREVFEGQLLLAKELGLPVIVHDRDAHADTLALLGRHRPGGVVHCFSGSAEMAAELVKLGFYIGFTGVVTFKNARRALEAVDVIPDDRLLIETDAPYMAPEPFRGKRCDSSMLEYTAGAIAARKGMDAQALVDLTAENARALFGVRL